MEMSQWWATTRGAACEYWLASSSDSDSLSIVGSLVVVAVAVAAVAVVVVESSSDPLKENPEGERLRSWMDESKSQTSRWEPNQDFEFYFISTIVDH
jgi:hypothetical protein